MVPGTGKMKKNRPARPAPRAAPPPPPGKHRRLVYAVVGVLLLTGATYYVVSRRDAATGNLPPLPARLPSAAVKLEDFAGSQACSQCHTKQFAAWEGSTHGHAGGTPTPDRVIAPFDGTPLRFRDAVVTPSVEGGRYQFSVVQRGRPMRVFQVDQVVGGGFMQGGGTQAFFSRFPDGTLRFLPFDYSRSAGRWFCNTRARINEGAVFITPALALADCTDWTPNRILGSSERFQGCQQCHGSQISVEFSPALQRYDTRFSTLAINCESCHGPGRRHVELARSGRMGTSPDIGMRALQTLSKDQSIQVCFQCHAVKSQLQPGYLPGKRLEDHFGLKLPQVLDTVYRADGRTRTFAYQEGHLASDCYLSGSMTCVDCHDPHSQRYRDVNGTPLPGRFDDRQCVSCHASKAVPVDRHTHHAAGSAGSRCVACHMPYLQQPEVGRQVRYGRSDHTIPIPRPAFDTRLGVETACIQCHRDRSPAQLQDQVTQWYGELKPHRAAIAAVLAADSIADPHALADRVITAVPREPLVTFLGATRVLDRYAAAGGTRMDREAKKKTETLAESGDLEQQAIALATLQLVNGADADVSRFLRRHASRLDTSRAFPVRERWAWILKARGDGYLRTGDFRSAAEAYEKAAQVRPDDPATLRSLGVAYSRLGDYDRAITHLRQSTLLNPGDTQVYVDLGTTLLQRGDVPGALASFRNAMTLSPSDPLGYANLGLALARTGSPEAAIEPLRRALDLDPSLADAHFLLGSVYATLGRFSEAAAEVERGLEFDPTSQPARQMLEQIKQRTTASLR